VSLVLVTVTGILLCAAGATPKEMPYNQIAARILTTYQQALPKLPLEQQKHFCLRMYRLTSDTVWLPPVISDARNVIATLQSDRDSLSETEYYNRRIDSLAADFERETRKNRSRRVLFEGRDDIRLQLDWLYKLATIDDYDITDSAVFRLVRETKDRLQVDRLVVFLLDTQTITVYAAQAANAVEYLRQLGLADIRNDFRRRFLEVFPDSSDRKLDDDKFADKVYGLTHIVISASGYYQQLLDRREYAWILDYFSRNQNRLLKRLSVDVIAEVGLCFLLCDDTRNPLVDRCRQKVAKRFDGKHGLILSPLRSNDLLIGEHRNILAYMVFMWSGQLSPGPTITTLIR
jgi:hypothetical protein